MAINREIILNLIALFTDQLDLLKRREHIRRFHSQVAERDNGFNISFQRKMEISN